MGFSQSEIKASIPKHLQAFIAEQNYDQYTAQDQAVWRYLMRYLSKHLETYAEETYLEGLRKTGISADYIPSIEEMNACLSKLGWRAIVVDGFIPPAIFMEFQAHKVLPIALEMRTFEHMLYTPAPDIVHESAGHAPFLIDIDYADFLQRFGEIGAKAMTTKADFEVYEAIRHLSIIKEFPDATEADITSAENRLEEKIAANKVHSEASLLSRLHWWTVEYGLVGDVENYRIYGAGLLSSLGESMHCLNDDLVKKIPLTIEAIRTSYDITTKQPQLFVTKSCKHLSQVLDEFADSMCFKKGGAESIQTAIDYETVSTAEYSSGVQVSGVFTTLHCNAVGVETYIGTTGPTQLAYKNTEIDGHGTDYHKHGFGSPIGRVKDIFKPLVDCSMDELKQANIVVGKPVTLEFLSGITVTGKLTNILRMEKKNILFSFEQCTVTTLNGDLLFEPSWGTYDMTVGDRISSVFAGSADKSSFNIYDHAKIEHTMDSAHTESDLQLFALFDELKAMRSSQANQERLSEIYSVVRKDYQTDWLIRMEIRELLTDQMLLTELEAELNELKKKSSEIATLISLGLTEDIVESV